jgi:DNA-binding NtrC family response regulator
MDVMKKRPKILLIDQHPEWLAFAQNVLKEHYDVVAHKAWDNAMSTVKASARKVQGFDLVFIGLELATSNLDELKPLFKEWHFVVIFPVIETNEAVRLLFKAGVYDCARKPYEKEGLLRLVADELEFAQLANGKSKIKNDSASKKNSGDIAQKLAAEFNLEDQ